METSQAFPRFILVPCGAGPQWPARAGAAPVPGTGGGGGVGALLGPEGTGPASRSCFSFRPVRDAGAGREGVGVVVSVAVGVPVAHRPVLVAGVGVAVGASVAVGCL